MELGLGLLLRVEDSPDQAARPVPELLVAAFQLFRAGDIREFVAQDAVQQGADDVAQLFPRIEALALLHMDDGPVKVAQQFFHLLVALGGLVEQGIEIGRHGIHAHEGGLEIRGQIQLQGGRTHDGVEQAVDGADVEAGQISQDDVQPAGGMSFSGVPRAMALRRPMTRSRISPAAALVKVMARISSQPEGPVPSPQEAAAAGAGAPQAASRHKKRRVRS